ncbi:MAG: hypothetical protein PHH58_11860 [Rhodoferax sp.]|nr:hypothetical protein [Rhodoferax sp.]
MARLHLRLAGAVTYSRSEFHGLPFGNVGFGKKVGKSLLNNYLADSIEVNCQSELAFSASLGVNFAFSGLVI